MIRLVTSSPALRGEYLKALSISQYELAERDRGPVRRRPTAASFFTRGLAGAVVSVVQAATERWLLAESPVPLIAPVVEAALRELAEGMVAVLPGPARAPCSPAENGAPPAPGSAASVAAPRPGPPPVPVRRQSPSVPPTPASPPS